MHIQISLKVKLLVFYCTSLVRVGQATEYRPKWNGINTTEVDFSLTHQPKVDDPGWDLVGGCCHSCQVFQELGPGLSLPPSPCGSKVTLLLTLYCREHSHKAHQTECVGRQGGGGSVVYLCAQEEQTLIDLPCTLSFAVL